MKQRLSKTQLDVLRGIEDTSEPRGEITADLLMIFQEQGLIQVHLSLTEKGKEIVNAN